jgi:hypothetical protein
MAKELTEAAREAKAREVLLKRGLQIRKDRSRTQTENRRGGYMIVDALRNFVVAGEKFELSLVDIEKWARPSDDSRSEGRGTNRRRAAVRQ